MTKTASSRRHCRTSSHRSSASESSSRRARFSQATAASSLLSASHGRHRRQERQIEKISLQRARRYGMSENVRFGRKKYTYQGVSFIFDPRQNREVTCYKADEAGKTTGSKHVAPIELHKKREYTNEASIAEHQRLREELLTSPESWTSSSVLVVDMSGSMRRDDVNGARCRSEAVWMTIAQDFIGKQLDDGLANERDLVSIVVMRRKAQVILELEPLDYVLYNRVLDLSQWEYCRPEGPGHYIPALEAAKQLFAKSNAGNQTCSLSMVFFSDGRPSDQYGDFGQHMREMADSFGERLTVTCIGISDEAEDFSTLEDMAEQGKTHGAMSSTFVRPDLCQGSLASTMTSHVRSLTQCKTSITSAARPRMVRRDIVRERRDDAAVDNRMTHVPKKGWKLYNNSNPYQYVQRIWMWDTDRDDMIYLQDMRCVLCYTLVGRDTFGRLRGVVCTDCNACFFCLDCLQNQKVGVALHRGSEDCRGFKRDLESGAMVRKCVNFFSVALKDAIFGEGTERIVRKFRFLDEGGRFSRTMWVAKESKYVEEHHASRAETMLYHKRFMRTQGLANKFARKFNESLDSLVQYFPQHLRLWLRTLPRIQFLEPILIELRQGGKEINVLVEEMLEGEYSKFNNNMGFVANNSTKKPPPAKPRGRQPGQLGTIDEDARLPDASQQGAVVETFEALFQGNSALVQPLPSCDHRNVRIEEFPQAFSHYTYEKSQGQLMVVDLQGVLKRNTTDGTCAYMLTDPAIHRRDKQQLRLGELGRTDRGVKGMKAFWDTHVCTDACSLLGLAQRDFN